MLDSRIKTISVALACSIFLLSSSIASAKENESKNPPAAPHVSAPAQRMSPPAAPRMSAPTPQRSFTPQNNISRPSGGSNNFNRPGGNQFNSRPGFNANTNRAPGNFSAGGAAHGPPNLAPHNAAPNVGNTRAFNGNAHVPGAANTLSQHGPPGAKAINPRAGMGGNNALRSAPQMNAHAGNVGAPLGHNESQAKLSQFNASRSNLHGINARPLPAGQITSHPNGNYSLHTAHGNQLGLRQNGTVASFSGRGQTARFAANGRVSALHTSNMDIHSVRGARYVTSVRPDHSLLVGMGRHGGYLERPYMHGGHAYMQRSYAWGGHVYNRYFYPYRWHGVLLAGAIASYYYAPHFYGWAYNPWAAPVAYHWGWAGAPWYGYYNGYFSPYSTYSDGAAWLTDYTLSQDIASAYDDEQGDVAPAGGAAPELGAVYSDGPSDNYLAAPAATPITPELKTAIAQEVRRQLDEEKAAAANPNAISQAPLLQDALQQGYVFIVSSGLNANTPEQQSCALTAGDTLQLQSPPAANDSIAVLRVTSTKKGDCPANTDVQLSLQNLADMQNDQRMKIDAGLASLQENQGKNGLPPAPADALTAPQPVIAAGNDASGSADVQALLDAQRQQADQAESEVSQNALSGS